MMPWSAIPRLYLPGIYFWNGYGVTRMTKKTYGELFFMFCEDIQDMDLTNALQGLMSLFTDIASIVSADITEMLKSKVNDWMASQPLFIQALFGDLCWES